MIFLVALLVAAPGPWAEAQRLLKKDRPQEALVLLQAAHATTRKRPSDPPSRSMRVATPPTCSS
jgi:hypothetical protein